MLKGDTSVFEELFQFACPKFVTPVAPSYSDATLEVNPNHNPNPKPWSDVCFVCVCVGVGGDDDREGRDGSKDSLQQLITEPGFLPMAKDRQSVC